MNYEYFIFKRGKKILRLLIVILILIFIIVYPLYSRYIEGFETVRFMEYMISAFSLGILIFSFFLRDKRKNYRLLFSFLHGLAFLVTAYQLWVNHLNAFCNVCSIALYVMIMLFSILITNKILVTVYIALSYIAIFVILQFTDVPFNLPLYYGQVAIFLLVSILVVLIRNNQQEYIYNNETRFQNMFREHSAPMLLIDPKSGQIIDANQAAVNYYGYPYTEFTRMAIFDINILGESRIQREMRLAGIRKSNVFQFRHRLASGEIRDVEVHSTPIRQENSTLLFSIISDITEKVRFQQELEDVNATLKAYSYTVAHDLREPLRSISITLDLIEKEGKLNSKQKEISEMAHQEIQRMDSFINQSLKYAKSAYKHIESKSFSVDKVVEDLREDLSRLIDEKSAELRYHKLPRIQSDRMLVSIVLQNLIQNAIKYHRPNVPPLVSITADENDERWLFKVTDNGIGIPKEKRELIFEEFNRSADTRELQGAGIGLATCKRIVERLGGEIWVESTFGEGSSFSFSIPK